MKEDESTLSKVPMELYSRIIMFRNKDDGAFWKIDVGDRTEYAIPKNLEIFRVVNSSGIVFEIGDIIKCIGHFSKEILAIEDFFIADQSYKDNRKVIFGSHVCGASNIDNYSFIEKPVYNPDYKRGWNEAIQKILRLKL